MNPTYKNPLEAQNALTSAFNPTNEAQRQAIAFVASQVPTITPAQLAPAQAIQLPTKPQPTIPEVGTIPQIPQGTEMAQAPETDWIKQLFSSTAQPPSASDTYGELYKTAGIDQSTALVNEQKAKTIAAQGKLGALNAQLAQINAEAQAIPIQVQQSAQEGGANVTKGGLAPITTAALRNNALKAIPLQAQVLGAQAEVAAAQGNQQLAQDMLDQAQTRLDRVFQIHMQDAQNQYNYQKEIRDRVYDYATKKEQQKLDQLQREDDRAFTVLQNSIDDQKELARFAIQNGQSSLAGQIASLDPKSPTFQQDIARLQSKISVPSTKKNYEIKTINGVDMLFDPTTGSLTPAGTSSGISPDIAKRLTTVNDINTILSNPALDNALGIEGIVRRNIPNTAEFAVKSQVETLVSSLALAARGQLKGQGAVSDFEGKLLRDAQTSFRLNMSPADARKQLVQVRGAILTSSGLPATVKVTNASGASKIGQASQQEISELIADGNTVEYQ